MNEIWQNAVIVGVGLVVAAYGYTQAQDEAWDGESASLVEEIAYSLNETGLTDEIIDWYE